MNIVNIIVDTNLNRVKLDTDQTMIPKKVAEEMLTQLLRKLRTKNINNAIEKQVDNETQNLIRNLHFKMVLYRLCFLTIALAIIIMNVVKYIK